jgi:capsular polysaccharide biosynthesis protein
VINKEDIMEDSEVKLIDLLNVIWNRKWTIIIPTIFFIVVVGIVTFFLPTVWEIDTIFLPGRIFFQTDAGQFEEISIYDPKQLAEQINQGSYNELLAANPNLKNAQTRRLYAENIKDTNLIRVIVRGRNIEKAKILLNFLFDILREDLDDKINAELEGIDFNISNNEKEIEKKNINIKSKEIEKNGVEKGIRADQNLIKISEERVENILGEMKIAKKRIEEIEKLQRNALSEDKEGRDAIGLLLYSNEIQLNLQYYNALESSLSDEKANQENLRLSTMQKYEQIKLFDTEIEVLNTEIEQIKNEIELLVKQKSRISLTQMIKEPVPAQKAVYPKRKVLLLITMILSLSFFTILAFFLEYIEKQKN